MTSRGPVEAQQQVLKLALQTSLASEMGDDYGKDYRDGAQLAVEEANAAGEGPRIELTTYDDRDSDEVAREVAARIVGSDALAVLGSPLSTRAIASGPIYAQAGLAVIVAAAESDRITGAATTYQANFKNSDLGNMLAGYLRYALGGKHAAVIFVENPYGHTIVEGFRKGAGRFGIETTYYGYSTAAERDEAARRIIADPAKPAVILAMLDPDAVAAIVALRRADAGTTILGPTSLSGESFAARFKGLPEEQHTPGFFTEGVYATVPVMLDSASAETLAFVERFAARYGTEHRTKSYAAVQGYDGARAAIAAVRAAGGAKPTGTVAARRLSVIEFLSSLRSPLQAVSGLLGPIWFTPSRGRILPIRVGRFNDGLFESAPIQFVPAPHPSRAEIAAGTVLDIGDGQYVRRQRVVYTGIYLNEITRIDVAQSTFTADFYVWVRVAKGLSEPGADPAQFEFPEMVRGTFNAAKPVAQRDLGDGTTYRLWQVRGDFKNDFDLHRYPADRQSLKIRFFNSHAASDRLVYVLDRVSFEGPGAPRLPGSYGNTASPTAFRNLTQWQALRVTEGRDNLVTQSALGDPDLVGYERMRELSGFNLNVELSRHIGTTLVKTLLPIGLMTLIMLSTLYFPLALVNAKVTVAITAALSGAVLLSAINSQLGNVGYVIAVEYGFYVFFALCLICIVAVLLSEQMRNAGKSTAMIDRGGRIIFMVGLVATIGVAWLATRLSP